MSQPSIRILDLLYLMKGRPIQYVLQLIKSADPKNFQVGAEQAILEKGFFNSKYLTGQEHNPVRTSECDKWSTRSALIRDKGFDTQRNTITLYTSPEDPDAFNGRYILTEGTERVLLSIKNIGMEPVFEPKPEPKPEPAAVEEEKETPKKN